MADKLKGLRHPGRGNRFHSGLRRRQRKAGAVPFRPRGQGPCPVRQHAENGFRHQCPRAVGCLASSGRSVATRRCGAARRANSAAGQQEFQRADLSLRHRRLVRRLYVADAGDQGQVHRPGDDRRHDHAPARRHGFRRVDLCRGQSHRVRQSARHRKGPGGRRVDPAHPAALRPCRGAVPHPQQSAPFARGGGDLDGTAGEFAARI
jgi:hypothetical protein